MTAFARRPLQKGDRVRLESPESPVRTVVRVTPCAAYVGGEEREVEINGKKFLAHVGVQPVARWAFVYPGPGPCCTVGAAALPDEEFVLDESEES